MNLPLYQEALRHIEANPQQWNQAEWCGTACCIAGHIVKNHGYDLTDTSGTTPRIAANLLNISEDENLYIFSPYRTLEDLQEVETFYLNNPLGYDSSGYSIEGYDREGYNKNRRDRGGYDESGFDIAGYSRKGFNRQGFHKDHLLRDPL